MSFIYFIHGGGLSGVDSKAISSMYSMFMFDIVGNNGDPITKHSSCRYMPTISKCVFCIQNISILIKLFINIGQYVNLY